MVSLGGWSTTGLLTSRWQETHNVHVYQLWTISQPYGNNITTVRQQYHNSTTIISQQYDNNITTVRQQYHNSTTTISQQYGNNITTTSQQHHNNITTHAQQHNKLPISQNYNNLTSRQTQNITLTSHYNITPSSPSTGPLVAAGLGRHHH